MRLGFNRQSDKRFVIAFGGAGDFVDCDAAFLGDRRRRNDIDTLEQGPQQPGDGDAVSALVFSVATWPS